MMINTILFEIILLAMMIISPDVVKGELEMIIKDKVVKMEFVKEVDVFDDDHKSINYFLTLKSDVETEEDLKVTYMMVDNGLYNVTIDKESPFEMDLVYYLQQLDWKKKTTKKQRLRDTNKKPLFIQPEEKFVEIKSPSSDILIKIPKEYFKKK